MAIPEAQLDTWSKQGAVAQSRATYNTLSGVLNDSSAPYSQRSFETFLQGSYGNDTNVYADSDIDVVIRLTSVFYYDIDKLSPAEKANFEREHPGSGQYSSKEFKDAVVSWLRQRYGNAVRVGNKAIFIKGDGNRRDADVLVCAEWRQYFSFPSAAGQHRADGVVFWTANGTRIVNFPKQHSENCTTKHQGTNQWFKGTVRMLKNMRNRMIDDGVIGDGLAPSYFLEGLLYNVPNSHFGTNFQSTFDHCMGWLGECDRTKLVCANERHWLLRDGQPTSWRPAECDAFLDAVVEYWESW